MKTKFFILLSIAAALIVTGCSKSDVPEQNNKITVKASIADEPDDATKVDFNVSTLNVTWANDEVIHFYFPGKNIAGFYSFEIDPSSIDGKTASFTDTQGMLPIPTDEYRGGALVGGADGDRNDNFKPGWYRASSKLTGLRYPYYQYYQADGPKSEYIYFATNVINRANLSNLIFRHKTCIVDIPVVQSSGAAVTLKSIQIKCDNQPISGCFYGGLHANSGSAPNYALSELGASIANQTISANAKGKTSITKGGQYGDVVILKDESDLTIGNPLSSTAQHFYLVVAPGNHGHFTISLTDGVSTKEWTSSVTVSTSAGKVYHFPTLDWSAK